MADLDEPALRALIARGQKLDGDPHELAQRLADACDALLDDPVRRVMQHERFVCLNGPDDWCDEWWCALSSLEEGTEDDVYRGSTPEAACAAALAAMEGAKARG